MFFNRVPVGSPAVLRREMGDFFENVFGDGGSGLFYRRSYPALNMWEEADRVLLEAEVPGLAMSDIEVLVVGDELTVKGTRKAADEKGAHFFRQERGAGQFSRSVTLPYEVDSERVEATLKDGVLTIALPKAESAKPRKIQVRSN